MKEFICDCIFNALDKIISIDLIHKTTMDSRLNEYDYASSLFISNKTLDFEQFKTKMLTNKGIEKVEQVNGFVNILLDRVYFLNNFSIDVKKEKKNVMVEFPSPNTNKPLHVGHLRPTLLGESLGNLLSKKYKVIKSNLINDRGIHICKSMLGYQKLSELKSPEEAKKKSDFFVGDCYVLYSKYEKEHPEIAKEAELMLQKWEAGDNDTISLWKKMNKWAIEGMDVTFKELNIKFDKVYLESEIYKDGRGIILDAYKKGKVILDDELGYLVKFSDNKDDYKVVLRKDGTSIYITQDIYLAKLKTDKYNLDKNIYVVASEQNDYFDKLKKTISFLGMPDIADKLEHYSFGMIALPSGRMKSREGNIIDADTLIEDVRSEALKVLASKQTNKSPKELQQEARVIADAAIKYFILKYDAKKDFVFDINSSLSFEGNSGPYVLYTYARICSLLSKMQESGFKKLKEIESIPTKEELDLSRMLLKYNDRLNEAIDKESVHFLVNYMTDLANHFNTIYANVKFITNEQEIANRYLLYTKMKLILDDIFTIMSIKPLERM
jgi:arginyl-tRNA synthetase